MKKIFLTITTILLILEVKAQEIPRGEIVDFYKEIHPSSIVEKMEELELYSISFGLLAISSKAILKGADYAINDDIENWQALWDTIDDAKQRMYQQIKDPTNYHCGIKKDGYRLFVIDYYTRVRDTVYLIPTGNEHVPYREPRSYIQDWEDISLILDRHWSDQNYYIHHHN